MSRKVYQIADPETGEVVAERHIVNIGPVRYEMTVKSKLALMLLRVGAVCFFLAVVCGIAFLLVPDDWVGYVAIPFTVLCIVMYISAVICIHITRKRADDKGEKKS